MLIVEHFHVRLRSIDIEPAADKAIDTEMHLAFTLIPFDTNRPTPSAKNVNSKIPFIELFI